MEKIIIDNKIPYIKGVLEPYFNVVYFEGGEINSNNIKDCVAAVIRTRTICNKSLLQGSKIKFIATATIGFDHIDTEYCNNSQIEYSTAAGCNANAVAHYVLTAISQLKKGSNSTIGIVGCGNIGSLLKQRCEVLGFKLLINDPPKGMSKGENSLDFLLANSDIVTLHVPLTTSGEDKTESLANKLFFDKMKKGSIFINCSRGEVVDENALISALDSGKIEAASIDVWRNEPNINRLLLEKAHFTTTHIAGYSRKGKERATEMSVNSIGRKFSIPELINWKINSNQSEKFDLTWENISKNCTHFFDIERETSNLKNNREEFENIRRNYIFREEFF